MKWTPAQEEALNARGSDLLLSAAAGSGKTAVLVERILRRITDPEDRIASAAARRLITGSARE